LLNFFRRIPFDHIGRTFAHFLLAAISVPALTCCSPPALPARQAQGQAGACTEIEKKVTSNAIRHG